MSSLNLLNLFRDKDLFDRFNIFVNTNALTKEERLLFKDIGNWYKANPSTTGIDWNVFRGWFFSVAHAKMGEVNTNIYNNMLDKLDEYDEPDEDFAKATMEAFLLREMCGRVSEVTLSVYEGDSTADIDDITTILDEYKDKLNITESVEEYFVDDDIDDLVTSVTEGGLDWRSDDLNKSVGRLRKGKLVVFGARPNQGKTTWLASELTHLSSQLEDDEVCLWFNNEEAGKEVKFRIVQAALQRSSTDIKANTVRAKADYIAKVGDWHKIIVVDKSDISTKDVERIIQQSGKKVALIAFDQLYKVHGFDKKNGNDAYRLQTLYQWARELAKKYGPVVTSHQADYTAEGVKELTMGQLHQNKTGIQGECDTIILMGRSYEPGEEYFRYFNVAKNKGAYGPLVDPALIEHRWVGKIDNQLARYTT